MSGNRGGKGREVDVSQARGVAGERTSRGLTGSRAAVPGGRLLIIAGLIAASVAMGFGAYQVLENQHAKSAAHKSSASTNQSDRATGKKLPGASNATQKTQATKPATPLGHPPDTYHATASYAGAKTETPAEKRLKRRLSGGFGGNQSTFSGGTGTGGGGGSSGGAGSQPKLIPAKAPATGALASALQPQHFGAVDAKVLKDRSYLLTRGTVIQCALLTRINSTVPGMATCLLTRNVWSDNGDMILLPKGSRLTGYYDHGVLHGQNRIFVVWNRVETPQGVVANLRSPGAGPLGASGIPGQVDSHFFERFGSAILLSLIEDLSSGGSQALANSTGSGQTLNLNNTSQATNQQASIALKNSVNIPPTLYKNEGSLVSVFVARDVDFHDVYKLEMRDGSH